MNTEKQFEQLLDLIIAADLACPEQVCFMVEAAFDKNGYDAAIKVLEAAKSSDELERKAFQINC